MIENHQTIQRIVLTGGPGAGKSTLLDALEAKGYSTIKETGRAIIQEQVAANGCALPWKNPLLFAEQMLERDIANYQAKPIAQIVFYDRAIPDIAGYLTTINQPISEQLNNAIKKYRYHKDVFILPPWPAIYQQDTERKQDLAEAINTYHAMIKVYQQAGYQLIEVPPASIENRLAFILDKLAY